MAAPVAGTKRRRGRLFTGGLVAGALVAGAGLYWFQPWKLWQDTTVNEALPTAPAAAAPSGAPSGAAAPTGPAASTATLAGGTFTSHEHATTGKAALIRLPDGSHTLRLEGLETSDGPDLRVWLTDAPVLEGVAGWRVFDDGAHVSLGKLKGNKGDQNYAIPADVNLAAYTSVTIWCDRFDVSFGAAALTRV
ncbi:MULTISPECIES: DM13 domain-containing protein [Streptomyces]|uniref:DM13 domain-containing protein n=1 Tax=Streptomyces TaxID=1883 RepID=UPI00226F30C1|nr:MULTISPECIES: DM13 domain-containing protein [unclassified Streptomyces]MCY0944298.1 DM13 domain-containing protein [Streptomyces sp. H34-AA3]MCZ4087374.1 DM13 domain-containing protein [Streptomyces sp. H34-S5]